MRNVILLESARDILDNAEQLKKHHQAVQFCRSFDDVKICSTVRSIPEVTFEARGVRMDALFQEALERLGVTSRMRPNDDD